MKTNSILLAACSAVLALAPGCASPGAPQPPSLRLPQTVNNLTAVRQGNRVVLTWSPPTITTDHQPIRWPTTTRVCRVVNQFPINHCGEPVAQIPASELASSAPSARRPLVSYEDVLPASLIPQQVTSQNQATYALEVVNQRGRSAGLSNQLRIPLVPTEPPPTGFRATLDAQGPRLQWDNASSFTPESGVSCLLRIYRRGGHASATGHASAQSKPSAGSRPPAPPEFALIAEQPCQAGPGEARDTSYEWEQAYDYKAATVTVIAAPGRTTVEVEGDDSAQVHLVTHDVFPPAVPSGLQAVFSSVGQKPFIDLSWAPNTESDLDGYIVYRRTGSAPFAAVSGVLKSPAWRDADVHPGQQYFYAVAAVDVRGNQSAPSAPSAETVPQEVR
jgi:hypothetical protein